MADRPASDIDQKWEAYHSAAVQRLPGEPSFLKRPP